MATKILRNCVRTCRAGCTERSLLLDPHRRHKARESLDRAWLQVHVGMHSGHACALTERQSCLLNSTLRAGTSRSDLHQGVEVAPLKIEPQSLEVVGLKLRILPAPTAGSQPARAVSGRCSYHSRIDRTVLFGVSCSDKAEVYHQCACARQDLMVLGGHHSSCRKQQSSLAGAKCSRQPNARCKD